MYPQQNIPPNNPNQYDFIVNPQQPKKPSLFNGSSVAMRAGLVLGLVFLILIVFVIVRNVISGGGSNRTAVIAVISEQSELLRIAASVADSQAPVTESTRNSLVTTKATIATDQSRLIQYASEAGLEFKPKETIHPDTAAIDLQLKASLASGTYDATMQDVLSTRLTDYTLDLKAAYNQTEGPVGRELLSDEFVNAELLLKQLTLNQR